MICLDWLDVQRWQPPGLLQTSESIRREASPIYYNSNTFNILLSYSKRGDSEFRRRKDNDKTLGKWLRGLRAEDRRGLGSIRIDGVLYEFHEVEGRARTIEKILKRHGLDVGQVPILLETQVDGGPPHEWVRA